MCEWKMFCGQNEDMMTKQILATLRSIGSSSCTLGQEAGQDSA